MSDEQWRAMREETHRYYRERKPEEPWVNYHKLLMFRYCDSATRTWPDSKPAYDGGLNEVRKAKSLRGTTIQIIVKLANKVLTPENLEYGGGTWHVEGRSVFRRRYRLR